MIEFCRFLTLPSEWEYFTKTHPKRKRGDAIFWAHQGEVKEGRVYGVGFSVDSMRPAWLALWLVRVAPWLYRRLASRTMEFVYDVAGCCGNDYVVRESWIVDEYPS